MKCSGAEIASKCVQADFIELPLRSNHVKLLHTLNRKADAPPHKDPFDRILISQAKIENMTFLTHDSLLADYEEPCVLTV